MDVRAIGGERAVRRIVALLAALAVLAERAAARSFAVRWLVLLILRRAETAAGVFVLEATGLPAFIEGYAAAGNSRADALRLAARFRALVAALATMLPLASRAGRRPARRVFTRGDFARATGRSPAGWVARPIDTS